ncbi:MAG: polysaccharide deacetylase family protein [Acidobacteria bacterium]|nr:polysaccharide deacetylase family protein [Acidobacteriota bacterium]MCL5288144.1 polysaccharide deacetylase family protein [Acidobacteriota bacterium]
MDAALKPVILTYHSISDGRTPLEISPALFAAQMEWLKGNARVLSLEELVALLVKRSPMAARAVVLTFDDGFRDFHAAAAPVLRKLGLSATVFLPTSFLGRSNAWPGQPSWVTPQPLMDWAEIRELADQGFAFGSHSVSHPDLTALNATELEFELEKSKREIELRINRPAEFFCYPYGRWKADVRAAVARHYRGACSTGAGVVEPDADPYALPRVDAHYVRSMSWFRRMFTRRFEAYIAARRTIRRLRRQPEGIYARA